MSNFTNLLVFAACFGAGFYIEPKLFRGEDAGTPATAESTTTESVTTPSSDSPAMQINMDLSKVQPEDFPEKVALLKPLNFSDEVSGMSMEIAQGTFVKPVRINGDMLVIQPIGMPIESEVLADDTNFKQLVIPIMLARLQNATGNPAPPVDDTTKPEVTPEAPPNTPTAEAPPEPAVTTANNSASTSLTEDQIIAKMKESILAGMVKEFIPAQISKMKIGTAAEVDGVTYEETGQVTFTAQTILGEQKHDALALFRDGNVEKWVWAKSMLEMR